MSDVILSDEELEAAFEAALAEKSKLTKEERFDARDDFDRELAEHQNLRFDVQKNYDTHKGRR